MLLVGVAIHGLSVTDSSVYIYCLVIFHWFCTVPSWGVSWRHFRTNYGCFFIFSLILNRYLSYMTNMIQYML